MAYNVSKLRRLAIKAKSSGFTRNIKAYLGYLPYAKATTSRQGLIFDIRMRMGMGAILATAIRIHAWSEDSGVPVSVISTSPLYSSGPDFLSEYFARPQVLSGARPLGDLAQEWIYRKAMPQHISLDRATKIFHKYFQPKENLTTTVDTVSCGTSFDLSIHFRGTDKILESGDVGHENLLKTADSFLKNSRRVFLATDDPSFARRIRADWPEINFISYDLGEVSDGQPRHFSNLVAYDKALEALVNIYSISHSPICVRTSSYMSSLSKIVNPDLKTVTINKTLSTAPRFPEKEVLQIEAKPG